MDKQTSDSHLDPLLKLRRDRPVEPAPVEDQLAQNMIGWYGIADRRESPVVPRQVHTLRIDAHYPLHQLIAIVGLREDDVTWSPVRTDEYKALALLQGGGHRLAQDDGEPCQRMV